MNLTRRFKPWLNRRGTASVEAALAMSIVLIPLCLGAVNEATAAAVAARLDRALQAATYYAWANPKTFTSAAVEAIASAAYGAAAPPVTATTSISCSCVSGGYKTVSSIACSGTCPASQTLAAYVTIAASTIYTVPAPLPGQPASAALAVTGTVRTR